MKLTASELAHVRSQGLYITEKCSGCGTLLNRTLRYTIAGKPEVYCSAACRDSAFFGDHREAKKYTTPGKCAHCGGGLNGKKRGSIFCDDVCRKAHSRKIHRITTAEVEKSRTPTQSNQEVGDAKIIEQGNRIPGAPQRSKTGLQGVSGELSPLAEEEWRISGSRSN